MKKLLAGTSLCLSGRYRMQAQDACNGLRLWEDYANRSGGLRVGSGSRRGVRLLVHDDQSSRALVKENIRRLIRSERVELLFGPYSSGLTKTAVAVARQEEKLLWNHGGTADDISPAGAPFVVTIPSPASAYFQELPRLLKAAPFRVSRLAIIRRRRGSFGSSIAEGLSRTAWSQGVQAVSIPIDDFASDRSRIIEVLAALRPEVVVAAAGFEEDVEIVRERKSFPKSVKLTACVAAGVNEFVNQLGEDTERIIGPSQWEPGIDFPGAYGPTSEWFVRAFQNRFGAVPNYTAAQAFACGIVASLCLEAKKGAGALAMRAAAARLDCHTFFGRFRIDPETGGQTGHEMLLIQWQHGRRHVVWPPEHAAVQLRHSE